VPFAVSSVASPFPQPPDVRHVPKKDGRATLAGDPVVQGYEELVPVWKVLNQADMAKLLAGYDPAVPLVSVTFPDPASPTGADSRAPGQRAG
jgi:hypothetical protein